MSKKAEETVRQIHASVAKMPIELRHWQSWELKDALATLHEPVSAAYRAAMLNGLRKDWGDRCFSTLEMSLAEIMLCVATLAQKFDLDVVGVVEELARGDKKHGATKGDSDE